MESRSPTGLVAGFKLFIFGMLHVYIYIYIYLSLFPLIILSLSSIHISKFRVLFFFFASDEFFDRARSKARPFARQWSFAGGRSCLLFSFPNFSSRVSILMRWRKKLVGGGARSRILPKERRTFSPKTTMSWWKP